jgi:hypothetical protein
MTAIASANKARITSTGKIEGTISGVPAIDYGANGYLVPETFELNINSVTLMIDGKKETEDSYSLTLKAKNSSDNIQDAIFNYPKPSNMGRWNDGWGFAGHLSDAPIEALEAVQKTAGINLVSLVS